MDECQKRIVDLVNRAKTAAGISLDEPLAGLVSKFIFKGKNCDRNSIKCDWK